MTTRIIATDAKSEVALEELMQKTLEGIVNAAREGKFDLVAPQALSFAMAVILDTYRAHPLPADLERGANVVINMLQDRVLMLTQNAEPGLFGQKT